jgi:molybdopterin converting factor subunit 1
MPNRIRVRLFAIQRELAGAREIALDLPPGATIEAAWTALVERHPVLAPGRPAVRFARNGEYTDPETALDDGDELAIIPPISGGDETETGPDTEPGAVMPADRAPARGGEAGARRILELRTEPFAATILSDLGDALATDGDGAIVGFIGRTPETPGTPAPGQEAEAARHTGRAVESLGYEAHEPMALAMLGRIADEIAERFGVVRLAIVHRTGEVPLGEPSVAIVAVSPHREAAFEAARYAIDETKARAPIWKSEQFADGHVWVGEVAREGPAPLRPNPSAGADEEAR